MVKCRSPTPSCPEWYGRREGTDGKRARGEDVCKRPAALTFLWIKHKVFSVLPRRPHLLILHGLCAAHIWNKMPRLLDMLPWTCFMRSAESLTGGCLPLYFSVLSVRMILNFHFLFLFFFLIIWNSSPWVFARVQTRVRLFQAHPAALVWFHTLLILSKPWGICVHLTSSQTWLQDVGQYKVVVFLVPLYAAEWMTLAFSVCVLQEGGFLLLVTDCFEETADCEPFICLSDCTHAQLHCTLIFTRIPGKLSPLSFPTCVLLN